MKKLKLFLISCVALLGSCTQGTKNVEINETNFPDENFRNWISEQEYGKDGVLTEEEIAEINSINVSDKNIKSLDGIKFFTALRELNCSFNELTALDVSQNIGLTDLDCCFNQLTALDVSQNTALYNLNCQSNQLTALDVSECTALVALICDNNQLTALDVSKNTELSSLDCFKNQIKGEAMDALVESLPTTSDGQFIAIYNVYSASLKIDKQTNEKTVTYKVVEQNELTEAQRTAVKAKGWVPYCHDGKGHSEYTGGEPSVPDLPNPPSDFPDGWKVVKE